MQRIRKAGKRDKIERQIIVELERLGAKVWQLDAPVDLLVGFRGKFYPVEIKSGGAASMRPSQVQFFQDCDAAGLPYFIFDHIDDTLAFIKLIDPALLSAQKLSA